MRAFIAVAGGTGVGVPAVMLEVDYSWRPGPDPWKAWVPGMIGATDGTWVLERFNGEGLFSGKIHTGKTTLVLELRGIKGMDAFPFHMGDRGDGIHKIAGYVLPVFPTMLQWEVTAVI